MVPFHSYTVCFSSPGVRVILFPSAVESFRLVLKASPETQLVPIPRLRKGRVLGCGPLFIESLSQNSHHPSNEATAELI